MMKVLRAPWLLLQRLMKAHSCGLIAQKELLDLARGKDCESCGEQVLTLPNIAGEHRFTDHPQIKPCLVASDLPVKWRITIDEGDPETKLYRCKNRTPL